MSYRLTPVAAFDRNAKKFGRQHPELKDEFEEVNVVVPHCGLTVLPDSAIETESSLAVERRQLDSASDHVV